MGVAVAAAAETLRRTGLRLHLVVRIGVVLVNAAVAPSVALESESLGRRGARKCKRSGKQQRGDVFHSFLSLIASSQTGQNIMASRRRQNASGLRGFYALNAKPPPQPKPANPDSAQAAVYPALANGSANQCRLTPVRNRSISSFTCNFLRLSSTILRSSTAGCVRHSLISSSRA